ncbi:DUF6263 family protein [Ekhidna sp.]|uniref:DUF6263 family protein n=1 Tax=Ekhidna sp. TaxID=2608089 RepID=UPI003298C819
MKYILTVTILILSGNLKKTDLGLNLNVGETYSQSYISKNTITQTINGMEQIIKMEITGGMDFQVNENLGDRYSMSASYSSLIMKMNSPMGEMIFSSKSEGADIFSTIMKTIVGKEFLIEMSKNGTISKIESLDSIFDGMFESFPELPEPQKQQLLAQLRQAYGEKAFKGNIEMITAIFPNKEVNVGESWKNSVKLESGMSGFMNNTFTLTDVNSDAIFIEGTSQISTENKDAYIEVNGMPTRYNLTGKMKTSYKLDPQSNWIVEGKIEQEISGDVQIKDNPNLPGGMLIPMVMKNDMTVGQ